MKKVKWNYCLSMHDNACALWLFVTVRIWCLLATAKTGTLPKQYLENFL